ncbi:hypothetical protein DVH05_000910 [Phytophthora capsici]|nr:hypothetical protein DVH05_000910 [Phytophthora capsici]
MKGIIQEEIVGDKKGDIVRLSAEQLAELLGRARVHDLSLVQAKLSEMAEYTRKLRAVQRELQDLLEQELEYANVLTSKVSRPVPKGNQYVPALSVLLEECSKRLQQ